MAKMKKIFIIRWHKVIIVIPLILLIFGIIIIYILRSENVIQVSIIDPGKTYFEPPKKLPEGSLEEIYQDIVMTQLLPYIQDAVNDYYIEKTGYGPSVNPWQPRVLSVERPNGYRTFLFIIKLEVAPYLGAHNSIGVDQITLRVSSAKVEVLGYNHIKDYPIPPWLQNH